jgi:hypothetical protein
VCSNTKSKIKTAMDSRLKTVMRSLLSGSAAFTDHDRNDELASSSRTTCSKPLEKKRSNEAIQMMVM